MACLPVVQAVERSLLLLRWMLRGLPAERPETACWRKKCSLLREKVSEKFGYIKKYVYLCTRKSEMVPWMSGLVYGLQNRPRRFESATHLPRNEKIASSKRACDFSVIRVRIVRSALTHHLRRGCRSRRSHPHRTTWQGVSWPSPQSQDRCPSTLSSAHRAARQSRR